MSEIGETVQGQQKPFADCSFVLAPSLFNVALAVVCVSAFIALQSWLSLPDKWREIGVFVFGAALAPIMMVWLRPHLRVDFAARQAGGGEVSAYMSAIIILGGACAISVSLWAWRAEEGAWVFAMIWFLRFSSVAALIALAFSRHWTPPQWLGKRLRLQTLLIAVLAASLVLLFHVDLTSTGYNALLGMVVAPPFDQTWIGLAFAIALAVIAAIAFSLWAEHRAPSARAWTSLALGAAILLVVVGLFNFAMPSEPLHYLTNIGPALHLLNGGALMVDTFSQYGPGPAVLTTLALTIGPKTFGAAQILTQVFNLGFCVLWLIWLYRAAQWKISALMLGVLAIALMFAAWGHGLYAIDLAPSILGLRYWPGLAMCLAIACLGPKAHASVLTFACAFAAGLWSVEALIAALAAHGAFLALTNLAARNYRRLAIDLALMLTPVAAAIAALCLYTLASAGVLPDYLTYLRFFGTYNPTSSFWAHLADPTFLAWIGMLLTIVLAMAACWARVFEQKPDAVELRTFAPMAALGASMALYYVFRSYDYTLLIALLPVAGLAILGVQRFVAILLSVPGGARWLAAAPALALAPFVMFGVLSLGRAGGPYTLLLHECRDFGRCTPTALSAHLKQRLHAREGADITGNDVADRWLDMVTPPGLVRDAIDVIAQQAPSDAEIVALLGDQISSELTLLHAGKWHAWPISFGFTDALIPQLSERIVAAPIRLPAGAYVLVNREEAALPYLQASILARIRAEYTLCPLPQLAPGLASYRVAGPEGCTAL